MDKVPTVATTVPQLQIPGTGHQLRSRREWPDQRRPGATRRFRHSQSGLLSARENLLIVSGKEEDTVTPKRPSDREPELMLLTARIEAEFGITRGEAAVSQIVKAGAMKLIRSRFCDHVDDCA